MPTEPEHNMDKTLKAYAEQRRAQAGAPAELHPATRRLLHGEIARQRKPAAASASWWHRLNTFWPRLAAASVIVIASFLTFRGARDEMPVVENLVRQVSPAPVPASGAAAEAEDSVALSKKLEERGELSVERRDPVRRLAGATPPAPAPVAPPPASRPVLLAVDKEKSAGAPVELRRMADSLDAVAEVKRTESPALPAQKPALAELALVTAKSEPEAAAAGNAGQLQARNWFIKRDAAKQDAKDKMSFGTTGAVLDNFAVEQVGDRLNLIDADGSTYTGALESPAFADSNTVSLAGKTMTAEPARESRSAYTTTAAAESKQNAGNAYRFRVSGTNRTLRQPVLVDGVLEGSVVPASNLVVDARNNAYDIKQTRGAALVNGGQQSSERFYYRVAGPQQSASAQNAPGGTAQTGLSANIGQVDAYRQQSHDWINANRIQVRLQVGGTNSPVQLFDAVPQTK